MVAILLPVLAQARDEARGAARLSHPNQPGIGMHAYLQDNGDGKPAVRGGSERPPAGAPLTFAGANGTETYTLRIISFDDLKPPGSRLAVIWSGLGIDPQQRIYVAISDWKGKNADDTVIFRYDPRTEKREMLGTLRGISARQANAGPGETFGKVHVAFQEYKGKMYFSSHDYHTIARDYSDMYNRRGGHFYAFDLKTETFEDLSKSDNHGVSVPYQGIIGMDILRAHNKLAGFTFPTGDLLIYDLDWKRTTFYPGVPKYRRSNVSRKIVATERGKVYFSYAVDSFHLWELDITTGVMKPTERPNVLRVGSIAGKAKTKDGRTVYLLDMGGTLYAFHVEKEWLEDLGSVLPPELVDQGLGVRRSGGLVLSKDEKKLYTYVRSVGRGREASMQGLHRLFEYNIATRKRRLLADFHSALKGTLTGATMDDQGRMYFGYHDGGDDGDKARLIQISRTEARGGSGTPVRGND
jgi:hypothetical protein